MEAVIVETVGDLLKEKLEAIQAKQIGRTTETYDTYCGKFCEIEGFISSEVTCDRQERYNCPMFFNRKIAPRLEKAGITKRFHSCTFESIAEKGVPEQVKKQYWEIEDYAAELEENVNKGVGLMLKGPVGTMKTTFAVAVLRQYIQEGGSGLFMPMVSLLDTIFTLKAKSLEEWASFEHKLKNVKLLLLDDLGAEHTEGWVLTKVDAIITERYNRCLPIIITTNMSTEQLKQTYAERIMDRLRSTSKVITFAGKSLREKPE
jgi:DNA replication protein DnaC